MAKDPFLDATKAPANKALGDRIGAAFSGVQAAMEDCDTGKARITFAWKFSKTSGWYFTYDRGRKRLFYLFPMPGDFLLRMVFNEKGVAALLDANGLPAEVNMQPARPKRYPEGTLLELTKSTVSAAITALLRIKIGC